MTLSLTLQEERYIQFWILNGSNHQKEIYLEKLCNTINNDQYPQTFKALAQAVAGLFFSDSDRVKRWAFNTIALLGSRAAREHTNNLQRAILDCKSDPVLLASGCAALFSISKNDSATLKFLTANDIPVEGALMVAASRFSVHCRESLRKTAIDIDIANPATLQNALVLIGLDKVPEFVFSDRHPYKGIVGKLNHHDDPIVKQYSVWAIAENNHLGVSDLTLNTQDVDMFPPNVKKWIYRLIASDQDEASKRRDLLEVGASESEDTMRENLATGLSQTYYPEIEKLVYPWFRSEKSEDIRLLLLDHMVYHAEKSTKYKDVVISEFNNAGKSSDKRDRMLVSSYGQPLYAAFRRRELQDDQPALLNLFNEKELTMVNNTYNFGNNANIGTFAPSSTFENNNIQNIQNNDLKNALTDLIEKLKKENIPPENVQAVSSSIDTVAKAPTKDNVSKLIEVLKGFKLSAEIGFITTKLVQICMGM